MPTRYDEIGENYGETRRADRRIGASIHAALGDAVSVINVGAGTGSYEPNDREVLAVEPSAAMIAQRPVGLAPVLQACAEAIPVPNQSFDAAMAVNTLHHWRDLAAGLRELRRVARKRVVIFLRNPTMSTALWLTQGYLPELDSASRMSSVMQAIRTEFCVGSRGACATATRLRRWRVHGVLESPREIPRAQGSAEHLELPLSRA